MTNAERLAEAPCRGRCKGLGPNNAFKCPDCGGSGVLVPGLRGEKCLGWFDFEVNTLTPCSGATCTACQGRSWLLIPDAERRQVMEDWCFEQGWNIIQRPDMVLLNDGLGNMKASTLAVVYLQEVGMDRNEALAQALCQVLGV